MSNPFESSAVSSDDAPYVGSLVTLRRVSILACGKIMGALYALLGLIAGGFMSLFALVGAGGFNELAAFGAASIILIPVMYGIGGFIGGVIMGAIYNIVAGIVGGLEFELE